MALRSFSLRLAAIVLAGAAGGISAETGLLVERPGLGLRAPPTASSAIESGLPRDEFAEVWRTLRSGDAGYGGARELPYSAVPAYESYGGLAYSVTDAVAAALELTVSPATGLSPRSYSLAGRLHTAFAGGSGLSVGVALRFYEPEPELPPGPSLEMQPDIGYALVPVRRPGTGLGPSYQLQLNYQYSAATTFGFVLGREFETFNPGYDLPGTGLRELSFTGRHWLTPSWALSYDLLSHDPGSFRLQGLRFGMRYRF